MRIKLSLPLQDLAYRFDISVSTASRIFHRWMDVLYTRLNFLIHWPDRDELRKTMPSIFQQNFGNKVAVIIDCFEVFIDSGVASEKILVMPLGVCGKFFKFRPSRSSETAFSDMYLFIFVGTIWSI